MTGGEGMKILILQGSPNRRGSTYLLADSFRQGAESAGHTVEIVDAAHRSDLSRMLSVRGQKGIYLFHERVEQRERGV